MTMTPEKLTAMQDQLDRLKMQGMESTIKYKELLKRIDAAKRELQRQSEGE